jgi:hypothetical protein
MGVRERVFIREVAHPCGEAGYKALGRERVEGVVGGAL